MEEALKAQESPNNGNLSSGVKSNLDDRIEKVPKKGSGTACSNENFR